MKRLLSILIAVWSAMTVSGQSAATLYERAMAAAEHDDAVQLMDNMRRAADMGYAPAQYSMGVLCYTGEVCERNVEQTVHWLTLAAEQGHVDAMNALGYVLSDADSDLSFYRPSQAVEWWRKAFELGSAEAAYELGNYYWESVSSVFFTGDDGESLMADARRYLTVAAEGFWPRACYVLGLTYYYEDRLDEAAVWFEKEYAMYSSSESAEALAEIAWDEKELPEQAAYWYDRALEADPDNGKLACRAGRFYYDYVVCYQEEKGFDKRPRVLRCVECYTLGEEFVDGGDMRRLADCYNYLGDKERMDYWLQRCWEYDRR